MIPNNINIQQIENEDNQFNFDDDFQQDSYNIAENLFQQNQQQVENNNQNQNQQYNQIPQNFQMNNNIANDQDKQTLYQQQQEYITNNTNNNINNIKGNNITQQQPLQNMGPVQTSNSTFNNFFVYNLKQELQQQTQGENQFQLENNINQQQNIPQQNLNISKIDKIKSSQSEYSTDCEIISSNSQNGYNINNNLNNSGGSNSNSNKNYINNNTTTIINKKIKKTGEYKANDHKITCQYCLQHNLKRLQDCPYYKQQLSEKRKLGAKKSRDLKKTETQITNIELDAKIQENKILTEHLFQYKNLTNDYFDAQYSEDFESANFLKNQISDLNVQMEETYFNKKQGMVAFDIDNEEQQINQQVSFQRIDKNKKIINQGQKGNNNKLINAIFLITLTVCCVNVGGIIFQNDSEQDQNSINGNVGKNSVLNGDYFGKDQNSQSFAEGIINDSDLYKNNTDTNININTNSIYYNEDLQNLGSDLLQNFTYTFTNSGSHDEESTDFDKFLDIEDINVFGKSSKKDKTGKKDKKNKKKSESQDSQPSEDTVYEYYDYDSYDNESTGISIDLDDIQDLLELEEGFKELFDYIQEEYQKEQERDKQRSEKKKKRKIKEAVKQKASEIKNQDDLFEKIWADFFETKEGDDSKHKKSKHSKDKHQKKNLDNDIDNDSDIDSDNNNSNNDNDFDNNSNNNFDNDNYNDNN